MTTAKPLICMVGLGYVGLPLAHAFAARGYTVYGYDVSTKRVAELQKGHDHTSELTDEQLHSVQMRLSDDPTIIKKADIVIVALPTPVDEDKKPDITILKKGTETVGKNLKRGAIVVFESTVYPGTTEDICGPILEKESGLVCGRDFSLGYSPERINPGDKEHTVTKILKIVSGQDEKTLGKLCTLYGDVIEAGIHRAPNIKVAEMAKAIENAQRDLNIAFVNEIAMLCHRTGIRTTDVLEAAGTKWNFLSFKPGLVGGHCIGVDPYYLVEKARQLGMDTHVITAGRGVNDSMGAFIAQEVHDALHGTPSRILVLGLTFKENVPDTRNSKAKDVIRSLEKRGHTAETHDPFLTKEEIAAAGFTQGTFNGNPYDAVLLLVPHKQYLNGISKQIIGNTKEGGIIYDLKSVLDRETVEQSGRKYMAL